MSSTAPAVLSMLHEGAEFNSAIRLFRGRPVLGWTLARLSNANRVGQKTIVCWDDQLSAVSGAAADGAAVVSSGRRRPIANLDAITAARRWSDGWRGGLLSTCDFDAGFHAPALAEAMEQLGAGMAVLIDPAAGLVDPAIVDGLVDHALRQADQRLCFAPAAPGLGGVVLRRSLIDDLAKANTHPGKLLHYLPDQPARDPISEAACAPVATPVARTLHNFKLDTARRLDRLAAATTSLNGQLISTSAESLVGLLDGAGAIERFPRDVTLELTPRRATRPIWWAGRHLSIARPELSIGAAKTLFAELAGIDDIRVMLAGVGDPLLAEHFWAILDAARSAGLRAIHVETDLVNIAPEFLSRLAESAIDVLSVHLPATTAATYAAVMGAETFVPTLQSLAALVNHRHGLSRGTPIVVPVFTKCAENLAEMEGWYDQWLRLLGSAAIRGPSDCGGLIPCTSVADMAPPRRRACGRLGSRLTILSDGLVVACEEDVLGKQSFGQIGEQPLSDIWQQNFVPLRDAHAQGRWDAHPVCRACKEWHRP